MTDFLLIMRVLFENIINFMISIKVPGVGISFMQLFIGVFALIMCTKAFKIIFGYGDTGKDKVRGNDKGEEK